MPFPKNTNCEQLAVYQTGAGPEVIFISEDELPLEPRTVGPQLPHPAQGGAPVEVYLVRAGSGSRYSGTKVLMSTIAPMWALGL